MWWCCVLFFSSVCRSLFFHSVWSVVAIASTSIRFYFVGIIVVVVAAAAAAAAVACCIRFIRCECGSRGPRFFLCSHVLCTLLSSSSMFCRMMIKLFEFFVVVIIFARFFSLSQRIGMRKRQYTKNSASRTNKCKKVYNNNNSDHSKIGKNVHKNRQWLHRQHTRI